MHRCLGISELLLKILNSIDDKDKAKAKGPNDAGWSLRCQLSALALVSKSFSEPALDLLWRTMDTPLPLIKTFPQDVWEEREVGSLQTLFFQRALHQKDFERYMVYASRVRHICMHDIARETPAIDAMVFTTIACAFDIYFSEGTLLPRLQGIKCADGDGILCSVYPLLSPQLLSFDITIRQSPPSIGCTTIFSALSRKSPLIEHLTIAGYPSEGISPDIMAMVSGLQQLESIDCSVVTHSAIVHLSSLPHLGTLNLHTPDVQDTAPFPTDIPSAAFPSLQFIRWFTHELKPVTHFMQIFLRSPVLRTMLVDLDGTATAGELSQVFASIAAGVCRQSLRDICLYGCTKLKPTTPPPLLLVRDLVPILKCPNLEQLTITIHCSTVELDDSLLENMARAWPKMLFLHLAADLDAGATWPSKCTLRGLWHLARHCPNLSSLGVVITASEAVEWKGRPGDGVICDSLKYLTVGNAPIGDRSTAVASFLSAVFPSLDSITAWEQYAVGIPENVESKRRWQKAIKMYDILVKTRREERDWMSLRRTTDGIHCVSCRNDLVSKAYCPAKHNI